jgi:pimeloyl-ACP methyl ester carboxylesterase
MRGISPKSRRLGPVRLLEVRGPCQPSPQCSRSHKSGLSSSKRTWAVIISVLSLSLAACGSAPHNLALRQGPTTSSTTPPHISWSPCPKATGYLCGTLVVPMDYGDLSQGSLQLSVIEHPVTHSRGVIVFNPGGPGESGVLILPILASFVPVSVKSQFTLVSFDERGTGSSDPLLCGPSPAQAGSAVAGTESASQTFEGLFHSCQTKFPQLFPSVDTTTSARDMNSLRIALGVDRINYYGLSYGTVLGSVYRQLYPAHVQSMVLDGAVDANLSLATDATLEAPAIQAALLHVLMNCTTVSGCDLGPEAVSFYERLAARLAEKPLPPPGHGDDLPVTVGDLMTATLLYLSAPSFTSGYFSALQSAANGNGAPLRSVAVELETDLNDNSLVGPLWSITCNDAEAHPNAAATESLAQSLASRFPLGGAEAVANNLIGCPGWADTTGALRHLNPISTDPPLVIGNTGDPNTPYAAAHLLADAIGGRLVTYVGYGHSWLLNGSSNTCMQQVVSNYLIRGVLPAPSTSCNG